MKVQSRKRTAFGIRKTGPNAGTLKKGYKFRNGRVVKASKRLRFSVSEREKKRQMEREKREKLREKARRQRDEAKERLDEARQRRMKIEKARQMRRDIEARQRRMEIEKARKIFKEDIDPGVKTKQVEGYVMVDPKLGTKIPEEKSNQVTMSDRLKNFLRINRMGNHKNYKPRKRTAFGIRKTGPNAGTLKKGYKFRNGRVVKAQKVCKTCM